MIFSVIDKTSGFYSELFFMVNHYLYAKKINQSFTLWAKDWLFRSNYGWTDYFNSFDTVSSQDNLQEQIFYFNQLPDNFSMWEYRDAIRNYIYLYNDTTKDAIKKVTEKLGLNSGNYDSIFIRRGDKLCRESQFFDTEIYLNLLLEKNPNTKCIFLQTDDYNCFEDLKRILMERGMNHIKVITLCHPEVKGMVVFDNELQVDLHNCHIKGNKKNQEYFDSIKENLAQFKPVNKMNSNEIYNHTLEMLIGIDIVLHSQFCILDNQSNVSKFISISHDILENVFDIRYPRENIQMNWTMCPSHW